MLWKLLGIMMSFHMGFRMDYSDGKRMSHSLQLLQCSDYVCRDVNVLMNISMIVDKICEFTTFSRDISTEHLQKICSGEISKMTAFMFNKFHLSSFLLNLFQNYYITLSPQQQSFADACGGIGAFLNFFEYLLSDFDWFMHVRHERITLVGFKDIADFLSVDMCLDFVHHDSESCLGSFKLNIYDESVSSALFGKFLNKCLIDWKIYSQFPWGLSNIHKILPIRNFQNYRIWSQICTFFIDELKLDENLNGCLDFYFESKYSSYYCGFPHISIGNFLMAKEVHFYHRVLEFECGDEFNEVILRILRECTFSHIRLHDVFMSLFRPSSRISREACNICAHVDLFSPNTLYEIFSSSEFASSCNAFNEFVQNEKGIALINFIFEHLIGERSWIVQRDGTYFVIGTQTSRNASIPCWILFCFEKNDDSNNTKVSVRLNARPDEVRSSSETLKSSLKTFFHSVFSGEFDENSVLSELGNILNPSYIHGRSFSDFGICDDIEIAYIDLWANLLKKQSKRFSRISSCTAQVSTLNDSYIRALQYFFADRIVPVFYDDNKRIFDNAAKVTDPILSHFCAIQSFDIFTFLVIFSSSPDFTLFYQHRDYLPLLCFFLQKLDWAVEVGPGFISAFCHTVLGNCIPFQLQLQTGCMEHQSKNDSGGLFLKMKIFETILDHHQLVDLGAKIVSNISAEDFRLVLANDCNIIYPTVSPEYFNTFLHKALLSFTQYSPDPSFTLPEVLYQNHSVYSLQTLSNVLEIPKSFCHMLHDQFNENIRSICHSSLSVQLLLDIFLEESTFFNETDRVAAQSFYLHRNGNHQFYLKSFDMVNCITRLLSSLDNVQLGESALQSADALARKGSSWRIGIHHQYVFVSNASIPGLKCCEHFTVAVLNAKEEADSETTVLFRLDK